MLEILGFVKKVHEARAEGKFEKAPDEGVFFLATTCTCHGVLNLLYVL